MKCHQHVKFVFKHWPPTVLGQTVVNRISYVSFDWFNTHMTIDQWLIIYIVKVLMLTVCLFDRCAVSTGPTGGRSHDTAAPAQPRYDGQPGTDNRCECRATIARFVPHNLLILNGNIGVTLTRWRHFSPSVIVI